MTVSRWKRVPQGMLKPLYFLFDGEEYTGIAVKHCNHPTALRPYAIYGLRQGEAGGLGCYRLLDATKKLAESIYASRKEGA